ncbi:MAG: nucleotidyltransferase family protein [Bacteroidales bacterium]|nr:nucleotidyltransferase family protein [Bacteroidales bacterium]
MKEEIRQICIEGKATILQALKQMDVAKHKLLIVTEAGRFRSMLSIGDIQRAIIKGVEMISPVSEILRDKINVATVHDRREDIENYVKERQTEFMPIIDDAGNIVDVLFWDELFHSDVIHRSAEFNLPVIIMAGGKGTRLRPLTNVLPKPLIPIGEQTMLEDIMDRFVECGCHDFYVSVNYKAEIIKRYLDNLGKPQYHISYFQEDKPLGTAGSLHLLKDKITDTFFVSNCDIIIEEDYGEILKYHRDNHNEITVVAAIKNLAIPYGTLETREEGLLSDIKEKPEYTFKINTGMYILEPHLINEIPEDEFYHITFLIEKLMKEGRRVGVYPINEGSWIDVGNWDEYLKFVNKDK